MNVRPENVNTHTIGFMMVPNFSMIAFASAIEVLRLANYVSGSRLFAWRRRRVRDWAAVRYCSEACRRQRRGEGRA